MKYRKCYIFIALSIAVCFLSGCGKSSPPPVEQKPDETTLVRQAAVEMLTALKVADKTRFMRAVDATEKEQKALSEIIRLTEVSNKFREDFLKTYGQQAWDNFQDKPEDNSENSMYFELLTDESVAELNEAHVEIESDKATYKAKSQEKPGHALKIDGKWLVDGSDFFPKIIGSGLIGSFSGKMADVISKYNAAIGKDGIDPEDIDTEMGRAMKVLFGINSDAPHLFDIDKLQNQTD